MGMKPTLSELARRGEITALEDRWLAAVESAGKLRGDMLEALDALNRAGRADEAATLAFMWLDNVRGSMEPAEALALARELILRCSDSDEMRGQLLELCKGVYADRPGIDGLMDLSGLAGQKSLRRALRTLEMGLALEVGTYLLARSDEHAARVSAIDPAACQYTITSARGAETLDADALALAYDLADPSDFRVLQQLQPERIASMAQEQPVAVVIGLLKARGGRMDTDVLQHVLSPRFISATAWPAWWSKARTLLRRSPNVVLEGRNPVVLVYHPEGQTLEEEVLPRWVQTQTSAERLSVVEAYLREVKARKGQAAPALVRRMHGDLLNRVEVARAGSPGEALIEALIVDCLLAGAGPVEGLTSPTGAILAEAEDLPCLLRQLKTVSLYLRAIEHIAALRPDDWPEVYARLLPLAPREGCEVIAHELAAAGRRPHLEAAAQVILSDFTGHLDAVCWLWHGRNASGLEPLPPREMLAWMLQRFSELNRDENVAAEVRRDARAKIRAALSAAKYTKFRGTVEQMSASLASTVQRTIERLDGLGQTVRADLLRIILEVHPELTAPRTQVDPWLDDSVIYATDTGIRRRTQELNQLINVKMRDNAKAIGDAAAHGDLSENSEYRFALEERDLLRARVARIQEELSTARLLVATDVSTEEVTIGTRVTLAGLEDGHRWELTILGPFEADMERAVYNYRAPLCQKLRGKRAGDTVRLEIDGREQDYRIEAITNALAG